MAPHPNKDGPSPGERSERKSGKGTSLLRRFLVIDQVLMAICGLLAVVAIAFGIKFVVDVNREIPESAGIHDIRSPEESNVTYREYRNVLYTGRNRMLMLLGVTILCVGAITYLFVRAVLIPLRTVAQAADKISRGNLNVTVPSNPSGEIGQLGEIINDLSVNFQEVLLLTGTAVGNSFSAIEKIETLLKSDNCASTEEVLQQVQLLRKDLEMLSSVVKDFEFYQARFDGRQAISDGSGTEP